MKIKEITETDDYRSFLTIEIDGNKMFDFMGGEPEDANLSRDFNDCWQITKALEMAYNAGKNGEVFELEVINNNEN